MEAAGFSEMFVTTYLNTGRHNPETYTFWAFLLNTGCNSCRVIVDNKEAP
jgi:hypothetical protein